MSAFLLFPAAGLFYQRLRVVRRKVAFAGALLSGLGLAAVIAIGLLAPFTRDYTPVHIHLAFAAFIGICSGTMIFLIVTARPTLQAGIHWGPTLIAMAALEGGVLSFLIYLYFSPHFFDNKRLLTTLAFWEVAVMCRLRGVDVDPDRGN